MFGGGHTPTAHGVLSTWNAAPARFCLSSSYSPSMTRLLLIPLKLPTLIDLVSGQII